MNKESRNKESYVLGLDCGTQSARVAVVRTADGRIAAVAEREYPHGIITEALPEGFVLAMAEDYVQIIPIIIQKALKEANVIPEQLIGIGVDATSCTIVPCTADGTPVSSLPEYRGERHAYTKHWKHHNVQAQTERVEALAKRRGENFLSRYGNTVSSEWMLPKVMQIYEENPDIFEKTSYYVEMCDWLTWRMTGNLTRSANAAGFKGMWSPESGGPGKEFLDELYEDADQVCEREVHKSFGEGYEAKVLSGSVLLTGACCGQLCPEGAKWLGLPEGIAVAAGMTDGHAPVIGLGMRQSGDLAMILGTSNALPFLTDHFTAVRGLCGMVKDSIIPGMYGCAAGQIAAGDMLDWFVKNQVPGEYKAEAEERGISVHKLLAEKAAAGSPEHNPLTVLDWWNGNRSILCDQQLTGTIRGLTLNTRPEDIYCAMLQGIACGTRVIIENNEDNGLAVNRVYACGGIPGKNPFFMQLYANILDKAIYVVSEPNCSALGSAICGAVAAGSRDGGYDSLCEAMGHMRIRSGYEVKPQKEYAEAYEKLYQRYRRLYDLLGNLDKKWK